MPMSDEIREQQHALVKKPVKYLKQRKGRGFSPKEIKSASIPLDDAKNLSIPIDLRRKSVHDENVKILSALYREMVSERSEASAQLDVTKKEAYKELKELRGIKGSEAKLLIEAGVRSLRTLVEEKPDALADDTKIRVEKIDIWINQAKTLIKRKGVMASINELLKIKGINKTYAKKLVDFGILTIEDLSQENAAILSEDLKLSEKILAIWIEDAMRLTGKPVPKKKKPIKEKKPPTKKKEKPKKKPEGDKRIIGLKELEGIGKGDLKSLKDMGITKIEQLIEEDIEEIASISGINKALLQRWTFDIRESLGLPITPKKQKKEKPKKKPEDDKRIIGLKELEGIGKGDLKSLKDLGITKIEQLIEEDIEEIASISGINKALLQRWVFDIRGSLGLPLTPKKQKEETTESKPAPTTDPLKVFLKLEGVGKKTAEKLVNGGFQTCSELLECDPKELAKNSEISEKTAKKIIESAKKLSE